MLNLAANKGAASDDDDRGGAFVLGAKACETVADCSSKRHKLKFFIAVVDVLVGYVMEYEDRLVLVGVFGTTASEASHHCETKENGMRVRETSARD